MNTLQFNFGNLSTRVFLTILVWSLILGLCQSKLVFAADGDDAARAIEVGYRALKNNPRVLSVRGDLAKLLARAGRNAEALGLLVEIDDRRISKGAKPYFEAERRELQSKLVEPGHQGTNGKTEIRLAKLGRHFHAPIRLGSADYISALIDTGASKTVLGRAMLDQSGVTYVTKKRDRKIRLADGSSTTMDLVTIDTFAIGGLSLRQVDAFVCDTCSPLLGQNVLALFDIKSYLDQDVEFMLLGLRGGAEFVASATPQGKMHLLPDPEMEAWRAAETANSVSAYKMYLDGYGEKGRYAVAARIKMDALRRK